MRAIDRLKAAANLSPVEKTVVLNNGTEFSFWHRPLTMAQREVSKKSAKSDEFMDIALQLLIDIAREPDGSKMFSPGDMAELKRECRDSDCQKLMGAILDEEQEETEEDKSGFPQGKAPKA